MGRDRLIPVNVRQVPEPTDQHTLRTDTTTLRGRGAG